VLGGVSIPDAPGLAGHSDGDVLLHAVIDALLGAAGLDDIGEQFPDTDPANKGIDSALLVAAAMRKVTAAGWRVVNCDCTVLAERPKLSPHKPAMRKRIADLLAVDPAAVAIKAKTNEGMGFVGRREGLAALATVLLQM
jgi:2-C-methyl-D-erythritol 2,4-cyclodiphosphate synthase